MSEFNGAFDKAVIWYGDRGKFHLESYSDYNKLSQWYNAIIRAGYKIEKITNIDWPKLKQWTEEQ